MGTVQTETLNQDADGKATSGHYGDIGDGTDEWFGIIKIANGGSVALGATTDSAASGNGSLIAVLKYIRDRFLQEDTAHVSGDRGLPVFAVRNDALATLTSADGDYSLEGVGAAGETFVTDVPALSATTQAAVALSEAATTALAASLVVKASSGMLYQITGYNNNAAARFLLIHNTTSLPADGQVPAIALSIPALSSFSYTWVKGRRFSTGITACFSTTEGTKTIAGADMWLNASYR